MRAFLCVPRAVPAAMWAALEAHGILPPDPDWARCRTVAEVRKAAARGERLWLVGQEAAGRVGDATALVLMRAAVPTGRPWVVEGLGERAQAAALALGAHAVVLDGPLWTCAGQLTVDGLRSGRDTLLLGEAHGHRVRVLGRGRAEVRGMLDADPDTLERALSSGVLEGAPQSIGGSGAWQGMSLSEAAPALLAAIEARRDAARTTHALSSDPFGTGAAVVQGPMANVTEAPHLGRAVLAAGGLPFCALGALSVPRAQEVLEAFGALEHWGAGVIGFDILPQRDGHLEAVARSGPRPVILAGGSVPLAQRVAANGSEPWLHTPDPSLVRQALDAELPALVLEGAEAGGHVGALTSIGLWEDALAVVEAHPHRPLLILAGGIGDDVSAAFAGAMAARAHELGCPVALQAGTAFFFTHEIVESGQVPLAYQEAALAADTTELVGATVNLPLRCAPSPFSTSARAMERTWQEDDLPRTERRERMERHNLGRARIAAQALERHPEWGERDDVPHYRPVPVDQQRAEGAFTMGQGAATSSTLCTVADVVQALSSDAARRLARPLRPESRIAFEAPSVRVARTVDDAPIAIVGMGTVLPGAHDVAAYLDLLLRGLDATGPIGDRWDASWYHGRARSQSTSRHAGQVGHDFGFDPMSFRIPPKVVPTMDRAQRLALVAAKQAVEDAGWTAPGAVDKRRAAVILGNSMGGEHAKSLAVRIRFREVLQAVAADPALAEWSATDLDELQQRVEAHLDGALPPVDLESMSGLLANVISGRVAAWLDWMGGNLVVDAACAASLAAVTVAIDGLRSGRFDAVLTGGVDADLSPETYVGFSRTHALSSTGSSPFSTAADGFVMAEGAAVLALCRLPDAVAKGWKVHALIHGAGVASDGRSRGITAPRVEGQLLAVERAWAEAGLGPSDIGAIEAHGTGTQVGDRTELKGLARRMRGAPHQVWVSSVKSNLGHLKGAAGAAGLVKGALSVSTGLAFPSLHAGPVREGVSGPLAIPRGPEPMQAPFVGVSAFGFGGTDHHLVVGPPPQEVAARQPMSATDGPAPWGSEPAPLVVTFAADTLEELIEAVQTDRASDPARAEGHHRVAICTSPPHRRAHQAQVASWLATAAPGASLGGIATYGIAASEPVVLLFPGQGAQRVGAVDAVLRHWPARCALEALGAPAGHTLRTWEADNGALGIHLALFGTGIGWAAVVRDAGLPVAGVAGHSLGAFPSLVAAEVLDVEQALPLVIARGRALEACPPGAMLAVTLPPEEARHAADRWGLALAAHNGPMACVLSGAPDAVDRAATELTEARPQRVDVPRAYHSPMVEPAAEALLDAARTVDFREGVAVWSTRTADLMTGHAHDLARAIVDPVRFDDTVSAMLDAGHRTFVECGPGSILSRLVAARGGVSIPLDSRRGGFPLGAGALWAHGHPQLLLGAPGTVLRRALPAVPPRRWPATHATDPGRLAAPEPAPAPAPTPTADVPRGDAFQLVVHAICEVTGYPADFVAGATDLEGELGVDSIRKMEVLGHLERNLGVKATDQDLQALAEADLTTLVAWVEGRASDPSPVSVTPDTVRFAIPVDEPLGADTSPAPNLPPEALLRWLKDHGRGQPLRGHDPVQQAVIDGWCRAAAAEGIDVKAREVSTVGCRPRGARALAAGTVVLATGGLQGIVGVCLHALDEAFDLRIVVLGRREATPPEGWDYRRCDLTDPEQVATTVAAVAEAYGSIDVVVHGAGALADGPALDAADADRTTVLGAKWHGAQHLADALPAPLALWIDMSSITGWVANPHQALYAATNRALAAVQRPAERHLTIGWTAWSDVGMARGEGLQRLLRARGLVPLDPESGGQAFVRLVRADLDGSVLVHRGPPAALDAEPLGPRTRSTPARSGWQLPLDPAAPALADHVVAGRPLVPAAHWVAAMIAAATHVDPDVPDWSVTDFVIHGPCAVSAPRSDVELVLDRDDGTLRARIAADEQVFAEARLTPASATDDAAAPAASLVGAEPPPYRPDKLFHGPAWRVLEELVTDDQSASGDVRATNGLPRPAELIDAAFQLACTWADRTHGFLALPVGAASLQWHGPSDGPIRLDLELSTDGDRVTADLVARDQAGIIRLRGSGLALQRATGRTP